MYAIDWLALLRPSSKKRSWAAQVHRTVWALGFTSLFTDISSEMIASILPMYLVLQLGMQPAVFGFVDGLYQGGAALVRVVGGVVGDRWRRHKEVATAGYGLSAVCRIALLAAGSTWGAITAIVGIDRLGKGLRTAPRDALITACTPTADLGTAFGVHRALDAAGATIGPIAAFAVLTLMPGRFDVLFAVSFAVAVIGVAIILLFVDAGATVDTVPLEPSAARRGIGAPGFKGIVAAGLLLALPTISDAFIYLALQRRLGWGSATFPLFYVATSLVTAAISVPLGRLADRRGRKSVLLAGYGLLAGVYVMLLVPGRASVIAALAIALLGAYYAATDGVLTAIGAAVLPKEQSGSGLAYLATASNIGKVAASVAFGLFWGWMGVNAAITVYLAVLIVAILASRTLISSSNA